MRKLMVAFGDVHVPYENKAAVEVLCKAIEHLKPDLVICLGDLLDCSQFSTHPRTFGVRLTSYHADLIRANEILDRIQQHCSELVLLEGNHEYRIDRWAARADEGRGTYTLLAPKFQLTKNRNCVYVPYGSASGKYPHYKINKRIVAVHGWSYAKHATKLHLAMSQGKSIIHAHTHRADATMVQNIWCSTRIIEARSAGCLYQLIPLWGIGRPVDWVNAFIVGYLGRRSDTLYTIPIMGRRCILPDGTEITAYTEEKGTENGSNRS